ncbi:hypothetical protein Moror_1606 [Moniliophthora roreri MCA 2997]|uniref:F-box domain-containing protein n=2 Tax=Moniliophthora roreri TaxID=221103 RepID=V2XM80_MONRO|nr:hypothetical protein Moror_1606 [Moniliophthora roreri MCA 2997]KAI3611062.1 hypothetical protein WG66_013787 [Moniliophthora roreri]
MNTTVLAKKYNLPFDVWEVIFQYCSTSTLLNVCLVCRTFRSISTRLIYRHLELTRGHETIGCFRTLSKNSLAARSVRQLWMKFRIDIYPEASVLLQGFFRLLSRALPRLIHIKTLEFRVIHRDLPQLAEHFSYVFEKCVFPQLSMLLLYTPITTTIASFLHRHQETLKTLFLMPLTEMNTENTMKLAKVGRWRFPNLSWFHASATVVPVFLSEPTILPSVRKMEVSCTLDPTIVLGDIIRGMKKSVGDRRLSRLSFNRSGWNVDLIEEIAMGELKFGILTVHCIWFEHLEEEEEMILNEDKLVRVQQSLAKISASETLHSFFWSVETNGGDYPEPSLTVDEELQWMMRFGEACPSLNICQIPHGLQWNRYTDTIWIPDDDPSKEFLATEWLFDQLHTRRFPALQEFLEILEAKAKYPSLAFIKEVVKGFCESVEDSEEEESRRTKTEDLLAVGILFVFWFTDLSGWKESPAYQRIRERWLEAKEKKPRVVEA